MYYQVLVRYKWILRDSFFLLCILDWRRNRSDGGSEAVRKTETFRAWK